jgi:polyisoprenoid-binding protein YceI
MLDPTTTVRPGLYRIDPDRSQVRYTGKHMFGLGTVHATFSVKEGVFSIGDAAGPPSTRVTVDAASFCSDSARRDRDVRAAGLLDVERYPDITFVSEQVQQRAGDDWLVTGTVTAHGRSVPVVVEVDRVASHGTELLVHGWARNLDRTAFGITGSRGFVGRYLDLEVEVAGMLDR